MGIFNEFAQHYYDLGLSIIPCVNTEKKPPINDWQNYCDVRPTQEEISQWEFKYRALDRISICMGKASKLVSFDNDYEWTPTNSHKITIPRDEFEKDRKNVEREMLALLPPTPLVKKGEKGWTRFYKWSEELDEDSNMSAMRNGIQLFDFLSWHRHTIVPPSFHSLDEKGNEIRYKWLNGPIEEHLADLPTISLDIVKEIKYTLGDGDNDMLNHRHGRIFAYATQICQFEKDKNKIIEQMVKKDQEVNAEKPYLSDKKHHKTADAYKNAEHWLKRIQKYVAVKVKLNKNKKVADKNAWDYFFETQLSDIRKDVLTEKVFVKRIKKSNWERFENYESYLRSYAKSLGMNKSDAKDEMERYVIEKEKSELLIDIEPWDRVDHLRLLTDSIETDTYTKDEVHEIFLEWGANIFNRLKTSGMVQNRCIIMQGEQGIGKDNLVNALIDGFSRHYAGHPMITRNIKDVIESVMQLLVVHLAEFDQTGALTTAQLKDLITSPSAMFREAYGRAAAAKQMCASWITTVNVDDFFRDPTGNRRFIVIPVKNIKWDYPKNISLKIISQWHHYSVNNHVFKNPELEKKIKDLSESLTPDSTEDLVIESYEKRMADKYDFDIGRIDFKGYYKNEDVEHMLLDIAKCYQMSAKKVRGIIKAKGYQKLKKVGGEVFRAYYGKN